MEHLVYSSFVVTIELSSVVRVTTEVSYYFAIVSTRVLIVIIQLIRYTGTVLI